MRELGPLRIQMLEGGPVQVGAFTLVPLVRSVSVVRRRATVGTNRLSGSGAGVVWLKPVSVLVEGPAGTRRLPIPDPTSAWLGGMLMVAAASWLLLARVGRWLAR